MSEPTTQLSIDGAGSEGWLVSRVHVLERLFAPTEITVAARTTDLVDLDALIGQDARVDVVLDGGTQRAFHGVVVEASDVALRLDAFELEVRIESKLSLLRWGRDHRIFQEMTVPEIVDDVMARAGLGELCEWATSATYPAHENVVQYGESDFEFVTRLLFEEGIGYLVQHDAAGERVVLFDDDTAYQAIEGESLLEVVRSRSDGRAGLLTLDRSHRVASDQLMQRDYDLKSPGTDLSTNAEHDAATGREVYLHPGGYIDAGRGQQLTERWLERLRVRCIVSTGQSNVLPLSSGYFFTSTGSTHPDADGDLLLLEVEHTLEGAAAADDAGLTYVNRFCAIPLDVPYRPEAAPEPPVIAGPQHALATVPGGEEIHADEFGRAKVRFLWDRSGITDDKSSTWLRVGQLALGGSMVMPRIDFECLVDFELGDLDRPAIGGHLYNAELAPPYGLPGGATISSMQTATTEGGPGANELRYEDSAGAEEIFINASKDMNASVDNNTSWSVGVDQSSSVGSNNTVSVTSNTILSVGASRTLDIGGNQSTNVGGDYGDGIGGNLSLSIGGNRMVQSGGDHVENTAGSLTRTVGSLQSLTGIAGYARTVVGSADVSVGAAWAEIAGGARSSDIKGSYSETIGALKFIKAKNVSISAEAAYVMNAAVEVVKAGGGKTDNADGALALSAAGAFKVKAPNIVFEADSKLVFRAGGTSITLTSAGMVTIKAPTITVKNAKALKQIMHKSN